MWNSIRQSDPEIHDAIVRELERQRGNLELIASENFVSLAVMETAGTVPTNKYAEGYPGRRYYGGCEYVDVAENLARERAAQLFGATHVNVQPHSGSQANMAVYFSVLQPGDTILGMDLSHGGHLTHGSPVNFSGALYEVEGYQVDRDTETVDYDAVEEQARRTNPDMIIVGTSAYSRILDFERFGEIARAVDAYLLADIAHIAGMVAVDLHPSPVPHADFVTSTTHKTLRGPRGGMILTRDRDLGARVDKAIFPGIQGGPLMHIIAAKAVCFREALQPAFRQYQEQVLANARALAKGLMDRGLRLVSGGTDTHLMLVDLSATDVTGKEAEERLDSVHITVNKNTIPFDVRSPFVTSGIRIGTPALTTRGMAEQEMDVVADLIHRTVCAPEGDDETFAQVRAGVREICEAFPLYPELS